MERPDIVDIEDLMPEGVFDEYVRTGANLSGRLSPGVMDWIKRSNHPRVERWRNNLRAWASVELGLAYRWQVKANDLAKDLYDKAKGAIRSITVPIHPLIKSWMETKYPDAWKDPAAIADTKRRHPKLFTQ